MNNKKKIYIEWNTLHNNTSSSSSASAEAASTKKEVIIKLHNAPKIPTNNEKTKQRINERDFFFILKKDEKKDGIFLCTSGA